MPHGAEWNRVLTTKVQKNENTPKGINPHCGVVKRAVRFKISNEASNYSAGERRIKILDNKIVELCNIADKWSQPICRAR